jgi:hypothetical protein
MNAKDPSKLDRIAVEAPRAAATREQGYREQALKISMDLRSLRSRIHAR